LELALALEFWVDPAGEHANARSKQLIVKSFRIDLSFREPEDVHLEALTASDALTLLNSLGLRKVPSEPQAKTSF
jgi:hypothetical protein